MGSIANGVPRPDQSEIRSRRAFPFVAAAITIGVLGAGCGNSSPSRTKSAQTFAALAFTKCMRAHGVPNLPDPGASISGPYNSIGGVAIPSTINIESPAFQGAQKACGGLLAAVLSSQGRPHVTASVKASLIAHAQCMRSHGIPGYQDPTFPARGGIAITDAGTDPQSPAYERAQSLCGTR